MQSGTKPRKNKEAMGEIIKELKSEGLYFGDKVRVTKAEGDEAVSAGAVSDEEPVKEKKSKKEKKEKKEKKDKKRKRSEAALDSDSDEVVEKAKKAKKRSKHERD